MSAGLKRMSALIMPIATRFRLVVAGVIALTLISVWAIPKIGIQNDLMFMIPDGDQVKEAYFNAEEKFGNPGGIVVSITSENGIFHPELLKKVRMFSDYCRQLNLRIPAEELGSKFMLDRDEAIALSGLIQSLASDPDFRSDRFAQIFSDNDELAETIADSLPGFIRTDDPDEFAEKLAAKLVNLSNSDPDFALKLLSFARQPTDRRKHYFSTWVDDVVSITDARTVWPEFTDKTGIMETMKPFGFAPGPEFDNFLDQLLEQGKTKADDILSFAKNLASTGKTGNDFFKVLNRMNHAAAAALEKAIAEAPKQIRVGDIVPYEINDTAMGHIRQRLHAWSFFKNGIYSSDEKSLLVVIKTSPNLDQKNRKVLLAAMKKGLNRIFNSSGYKIRVAGYSVVDEAVGTRLVRDSFRLFPLVTGVVVIFLFLSFRSFAGVVYPLLTVLLAVLWCVGTMSICNVPLSVVTVALPVLMVAVGSAYGIHLVHYYSHHCNGTADPAKGVAKTLDGTGIGVIMAGLTTVAGFASLAFNDIIPLRDFGIFTALGTFFALGVSLILISALLAKFGIKSHKKTKTGSQGRKQETKKIRFCAGAGRIATANPGRILAVTIAILIACGFYLSAVRVEMNNITFFKKGSDIRKADNFINSQFSGTVDIRIVFSSDRRNAVLSPVVIEAMQKIEKMVKNRYPQVGKTISMLDLIRKMNQAFYFNDPSDYRIPGQKDLAGEKTASALKAHLASYLDKYRRSDTRAVIDAQKMNAAMTLQVKTGSSAITNAVMKSVDSLLSGSLGKRLKKAGITWHITGTGALYLEAEHLIVHGQLKSVAVSLVIVLILVALVMQSVMYGLFAVIPLCAALVVNFGIMGLLDIPLDAATAITACVAIGIGIDYGLHYLTRYRHQRGEGKDHRSSARETEEFTGGAILINALAVTAGFLVLTASEFVPLINLGILIATTMLTSATGALTLLPAVLTIADRFNLLTQTHKE